MRQLKPHSGEQLFVWRNDQDDGWSLGFLKEDACDWDECMCFSDELAERILSPDDLARSCKQGTDFVPCRLLLLMECDL